MPTTSRERTIVFGVTIDYQLRYHDGLYQKLADRGWEVHIVAGPGPIGASLATHPGITLHLINMTRNPHPLRDIAGLVRWTRVLRAVRPGAIVVGTPKAGLLGSMAGMISRVPRRVYELHGLRLESASGLLRHILRATERVACMSSTEVVSVGESLRKRVIAERLTSKDKIGVFGKGSPNGVDVKHFETIGDPSSLRVALGIPVEAPTVAFIGRLAADKGLKMLTRAMAEVERRTNAHLLIVGESDDADSEYIAKELENVTFAGGVDDVAPFLEMSEVLCLPSKREGLPTVILEAFAAGVPVVATAVTGSIDLVVDGETGSLVEVGDVVALSNALIAAIQDRDDALRMASKAKALAEHSYSRDGVQDTWIRELEAPQQRRRA